MPSRSTAPLYEYIHFLCVRLSFYKVDCIAVKVFKGDVGKAISPIRISSN